MRLAILVLALLLAACTDDDATVEAPEETTTSVDLSEEAPLPTAPTTTSPCPALRSVLEDAKRERLGGDSPQKRAAVDAAARQAREAGCDISDLVAPSVGVPSTAPPATAAPTTAAKAPATTRATLPPQTSPPQTEASGTYYANCSEARAAGAAPVHRGEPGYGSHLDRDGDGVGCE